MSKAAISSGGSGDVIFSIPIMKALGITRLLIKESFFPEGFGSMYTGLKELIEYQGFEVWPTRDDGLGFDRFEPGVRYDVNMDAWRSCRMRGRWHIMQSIANHWHLRGISPQNPWLKIDDKPTELTGQDYTLWFLSPRWRQSDYDWKKGFEQVGGNKYFIGFLEDWETFTREVGWVEYAYTPDLMVMARMIRDCRALYTNQSVALALAQSMGKDYFCAFKNGKTNTRTYTKNEHAL